jgi:aldehyde dehydrogenase (NAD+)
MQQTMRVLEEKMSYEGKNYIGGFKPHRGDFNSLNPSDDSVLGSFPQSTKEEVDSAVNLAYESKNSWKSLSRIQRAEHILNLCRMLEKKQDYVARHISIETGKSFNESKAEVVEALHMAQYCFGRGREACGEVVSSELAERDSYVLRKPKGVVAVVAPWNFPFAIGGFWCAAPALLEGNTVVFKPSELTPIVGQITAELYDAAGFPPGVFNMIHGDGHVGSHLVSHELVNHVAFTGSVEVGRHIRRICAEGEKTCSCEMGSKSAVIVFADADIDLAASACLNSAFKLSGQRCVSSGRVLVQRSILARFKERFLEKVRDVFVGDPAEEAPEGSSLSFGPLISRIQMERVLSFNEMVRADSDADVLCDLDCSRPFGNFVGPFVYQVEWADKAYLKQEVFGPHLAIVPFDDVCHAINIYNDTPYGLALGVITDDFRVMRDIRNWCDAGMIYFNLGSIGAESHLPFTGVKMSGNGGSSAAGTFDSVVHKVAVSVNHARCLNFPQGLK